MIEIEQTCLDSGMPTTRHRSPPLRETHFDNARLAALGIEVMTLGELGRRVPARTLAAPERLDFYLLLLVASGRCRHVVDFVDRPLSRGSLVFVRPGQVQQWRLQPGVEGRLILVAPAALSAGRASPSSREVSLLALDEWPACSELSGRTRVEIEQEIERLGREFERYDASALGIALIRQMLVCLMLRLARWHAATPDDAPAGGSDRAHYRLFVRELEAGFREHRDVRHYAQRLGYSESTLSRACLAAEGRSAKQVIDRRVALEARRMLAHGDASVAEIGHQLGFSEPTNFVKFFGRLSDCTPTAFRARMTVA